MVLRDLEPLFQPLTIGNTTLRNRFVVPGMQRGFMDDGAPTPKMVAYMRRCAAVLAECTLQTTTSSTRSGVEEECGRGLGWQCR